MEFQEPQEPQGCGAFVFSAVVAGSFAAIVLHPKTVWWMDVIAWIMVLAAFIRGVASIGEMKKSTPPE